MDADAIAAAFPKAVNAEGDLCLYEVFGIDSKATASQVKIAYYKHAKRYHPDKSRDDPTATQKFQAIGRIYEVLSNKEERAYYDERGEMREKGSLLGDKKTEAEWADHWRCLFKKVETSDIDKFRAKYVGSEEEAADILKAYVEVGGDVFGIIDNVMLASDADEKRIRKVVDAGIESGSLAKLPGYKTYKAGDKQRKKRAKENDREAEEADHAAQGGGPDDMGSLMAMIRAKDAARGGNPLDAIIQKYSKAAKKTKKAAGAGSASGGRATASGGSKRGLKKRN